MLGIHIQMIKLLMQYFVRSPSLNLHEFLYKFHLDHHRDLTPRTRLIAFANQIEHSTNDNNRHNSNIDIYNTINIDINDLIIKPWCSRFCSRCYTYK